MTRNADIRTSTSADGDNYYPIYQWVGTLLDN